MITARAPDVRISVCVLALVMLGCAGPAGQAPNQGPPLSGTILYSTAPWDGSAYEIVLPIHASGQPRDSVIRINVWGNPEYAAPHTLRVLGNDSMKEGGSACFQAGLDHSLPEQLTGSITFVKLAHKLPVSGNFDLSTSGRRRFAGRFVAAWGNKGPLEIR